MKYNEKINELLNYKWELFPEKFMLDNLRYVLNNYYNESNFEIFQKLLYIQVMPKIIEKQIKIIKILVL
jgi:hypothetical protein